MKSWTVSNLEQIGPFTLELLVLECRKSPYSILSGACLVLIETMKLADNLDRHKILDEFEFQPDQTTVMILRFQTDMPEQTVQTQIRLLLEEQRSSLIRVYTVCHSVCIVWTHYSIVESHSSNFRVITTNVLGVRISRKFTVFTLEVLINAIFEPVQCIDC